MKNEANAFQLGFAVLVLVVHGSTDTPVVDMKVYKTSARALAMALGISLDVEALVQSDVEALVQSDVLAPVSLSLEIAHSTLVVSCFKFGFTLGLYFAFLGMYPLGDERTQEDADRCEQV